MPGVYLQNNTLICYTAQLGIVLDIRLFPYHQSYLALIDMSLATNISSPNIATTRNVTIPQRHLRLVDSNGIKHGVNTNLNLQNHF